MWSIQLVTYCHILLRAAKIAYKPISRPTLSTSGKAELRSGAAPGNLHVQALRLALLVRSDVEGDRHAWAAASQPLSSERHIRRSSQSWRPK